jgi:BlaI family penicillinase repressor
MSRISFDVTEAELSVLEMLWEVGGATVRQLVEKLYPSGSPTAPPTVQKLLERLEAKGCVARDRSGQIQTFRATVDRATLISRRLRNLAEDLCGGSITSLLTHLVQDEGLGVSERKALRKLVDEWDSQDPRRES